MDSEHDQKNRGVMMARFEPIFKYYEFKDNQSEKIVVEIDPQDGSDWPFHNLVLCELNPDAGQWELFQNEWVPLATTSENSLTDKKSVIKEACYQLVQNNR
jgi:hypothetical protein